MIQELFFEATGLGLNAAIVILLLSGVLAALSKAGIVALRKESLWGLGACAIGALGCAVNDSRGLDFVNFVLIFGGIGWMTMIELMGGSPSWTKLLLHPFLYPIAVFVLGLTHLFTAQWQAKTGWMSRRTAAVAKGAAISLPVLLVFGSILSSADPMFAKLVTPTMSLDIENVVPRGMLFATALVGFFGMVSVFVPPIRAKFIKIFESGSSVGPPPIPIPQEEGHESHVTMTAATFLGSIALLFALFIGVQLRYLFGGAEHVLRTNGLTFAEYARRGFFEICWVVGLMIPLLLAAQSKLKDHAGPALRWFHIAAGSNAVLLAALLGSAAYRMGLYVDAYGLSPLRIYVSAGIAWMALILLFYGLQGIKGRLPQFGRAVLVSAVAVVAGLNVVRPDWVIARYNLAKTGRSVDEEMISFCGADARSVLVGTSYEKKWRASHSAQQLYSRSLSEWRAGE